MANEKITFSAESFRKLSCPADKSRLIIYDKKQPKLACIVSKTGIKTFALHAYDKIRKKPLQHTIGRYPDICINNARDIAGKLLAQLADGVDIKAAVRAIREEPTVDDIFKDWLKRIKKDNRTWQESEKAYALHIKPHFGSKRISEVTPHQVRRWHLKLAETPRQKKLNGKKAMLSPTTANRRLALLRAIFNQEAPHLDNPCYGTKAFKEKSRDRFLKPEELQKFYQALNAVETPQFLRDLIYLALFTGARRSNLLSMAWGEIDFQSNIWTIPAHKSKNSEIMQVPLVLAAVEILEKRKRGTSSVFVFPGTGRRGHLVEPRKTWTKLVERSGLKDLRFHDLRRTCGSFQAAGGANQAIIGKSLGHKNMASTAVYTRLDLDPVRASMEKAATAIQMAGNFAESKITYIKKEE